MASSLIRINEAAADELCQLRSIGPKRARRIVRFREQVGPLSNTEDLATAAGIGLATAQALSDAIDWRNGTPVSYRQVVLPAVAIGACMILLTYGMYSMGLDRSRPAATLYNTGAILILLCCLALVGKLLVRGNDFLLENFRLLATATGFSGITLMASLAVALQGAGGADAFADHVLSSWKFFLFVSVIAVIVLGPAWVLKTNLRNFELAARVYDHGQMLLAVLVMLVLRFGNATRLLEELFAFWAGVIFIMNGWQLMHGTSAFVSALSRKQRARLDFLVQEEDGVAPRDHGRASGVLLASLGLILLGLSIAGLLHCPAGCASARSNDLDVPGFEPDAKEIVLRITHVDVAEIHEKFEFVGARELRCEVAGPETNLADIEIADAVK